MREESFQYLKKADKKKREFIIKKRNKDIILIYK